MLSTLLAALAALALPGCDGLGGGATIQLDSAEVSLPSGASVHDVAIGGVGARDSLDPATVAARPGDVVRFVVGDHRTHALAFEGESLSPEVLQFLESTLQLRGPPLVNAGSSWVVSLADAPPGRYAFVCRTHGARGVVTVGSGR
ncbi:MAG TPA: hypothetical protein VMM12_18885 [Longimicrobiales bacterium]|nr:hypothetical protein [Longimicrobiales bacterium]